MRVPGLTLVGLLLLTACGSPTGQAPAAHEPPAAGAPEAPVPASAIDGPDVPAAASPTPERTAPALTPPSADAAARPASSTSDLPLELTVEPVCVTRGSTLSVTLTATPSSRVSLMAVYPDGRSYEHWYVGGVEPDGTVRQSWVVPPDASEGEGKVLAAAKDTDTDEQGTTWEPLRVATSC